MSYHELSIEERVTIQLGLAQGFSQRRIARLINRAPSTISRELRRNREACSMSCTNEPKRKSRNGGRVERVTGSRSEPCY
jgi:IS30 family transposase